MLRVLETSWWWAIRLKTGATTSVGECMWVERKWTQRWSLVRAINDVKNRWLRLYLWQSVPDTWLLGTWHPGLSGQDAYIGCFREQVNSTSFCKTRQLTGGADKKGCAWDAGGRLSRSSEEAVVMNVERRAKLVYVISWTTTSNGKIAKQMARLQPIIWNIRSVILLHL